MSHSHTATKKPVRHDSFSRQVTETSSQVSLRQNQELAHKTGQFQDRVGLGVAYVETHMM